MGDDILLFVYGLLLAGGAGYDALDIPSRTAWVRHDRVSGHLYDLGGYPGLVLAPDGEVHGDLLAIQDKALLGDMDIYKLYDPEQPAASEYRRVKTVSLDSGKTVWAYEYNLTLKGRPLIASGRWTAYSHSR